MLGSKSSEGKDPFGADMRIPNKNASSRNICERELETLQNWGWPLWCRLVWYGWLMKSWPVSYCHTFGTSCVFFIFQFTEGVLRSNLQNLNFGKTIHKEIYFVKSLCFLPSFWSCPVNSDTFRKLSHVSMFKKSIFTSTWSIFQS